jgi:hypothetical protein
MVKRETERGRRNELRNLDHKYRKYPCILRRTVI